MTIIMNVPLGKVCTGIGIPSNLSGVASERQLLNKFVATPPSFSATIAKSRGGQTFHTKSRIRKNFEAEGRTDWKSKKGHHVRRCPIFHSKSSVEQKKDRHVFSISLNISKEQKLKSSACFTVRVYTSVSARGPHAAHGP